jgi:predicted Zn finger-like uncharacterized protein
MSISTTCPSCKALFRLPDNMAGKKVKCQKCANVFVVPAAAEEMTVAGTSVPGSSDGSLFDHGPGQSLPPEDANPKSPTTSPITADDVPVTVKLAEHEEDEEAAEPPPARRKRRSDDDDDDEPTPRSRRRRPAKSNKVLYTVLAVLAGGGVLSCCACSGVGVAYWALHQRSTFDVAIPADGTFRADNRITSSDPVDQFDPQAMTKRYKLYKVTLEKGKQYQIDLMSRDFDSFLHVQDDRDVIVARDDDGGEGLNSRLVFRPQRTGIYRIYVTSLGGHSVGAFTFIIRRL